MRIVGPPVVDIKSAGRLGEAKSPGSSVVIVTFNSESSIGACLHSVLTSLHEGDEVIVVDNASKDRTVEVVKEFQTRTERLQLIESPVNLGFSAGSNVGLKASKGAFLVLLNPDTVVWPRWLEKLRRGFHSSDVGAVGPLSDNIGGEQLVSLYVQGVSLHEWQDLVTEQCSNQYLETKLLIGLCLVCRRETLNQIGLLDEDLFLGNDDLEISWRLRTHSLKLVIAKDVFVHHVDHVSFKSLPRNQTEQWLLESKIALEAKLARYYGGNVPSQLELWGVEMAEPKAAGTQTLLEFLRSSPMRFFTDKDSTHCYIEHFYSPLFEKLPEDLTILEIGVFAGGGVLLFSSFRPRGYVVGLDVSLDRLVIPVKGDNYEILMADAYLPETVELVSNRRYDLIIDDGPHTPATQLFSLEHYCPLLKEGGILVIEDVQSIEIATALCAQTPGFEIVDLRSIKGRYDDILVVRSSY